MHAELTVHAHGLREDGKTHRLELGGRVIVGRGSDCELRLRDKQVSRRHALLTLERDGLHVTDLGSRNGTLAGIRELRKKEIWLLPPGESIRVDPYRIEVELFGFTESQREITQRWRFSDAEALPEGYELVGLLGEGGQSRVWEGRRKADGLQVAIKVLHGTADEEDRARLVQEGDLCRRIDSPYVVQAYELGVFAGRPYLVMELVLGTNVERLLGRGPMEPGSALMIAEDVARGLAAAHVLGVIHRDVKPSNVLVTTSGAGKLVDFGIAKLQQGGQLTQSGVGLGSLPYVPPEQLQEAHEVDRSADLYALGATLYHMLSGEPPFQRPGRSVDGLRATMDEIACAIPRPLAEVREGVPLELSDLVAKLLEKDPADRPASAREVASALMRIREARFPYVEEDWGHQTDQVARAALRKLAGPGDIP
jgi:serine/threonine protein kinase